MHARTHYMHVIIQHTNACTYAHIQTYTLHAHAQTTCMCVRAQTHTTTTKRRKEEQKNQQTNKKSSEGTIDPELTSLQQPVAALERKEMLT